MERTEWRASVYKKVVDECPEGWATIRAGVLKRDKYCCYRCEVKTNLSVHHILPRERGGSENMNNLITLCYKCHDIVELSDCKCRADILATYEVCTIEEEDDSEPVSEFSFDRPEWHKWVYGGCKKP